VGREGLQLSPPCVANTEVRVDEQPVPEISGSRDQSQALLRSPLQQTSKFWAPSRSPLDTLATGHAPHAWVACNYSFFIKLRIYR